MRNSPPPEKVLLIAPIVAEVGVVLKYCKKFGEAITSVITPLSYPNIKEPAAASVATEMA